MAFSLDLNFERSNYLMNHVGEVFDSITDTVIEDSAMPKMKYGIGQQVVVDYGDSGNFQCGCFFCNKSRI